MKKRNIFQSGDVFMQIMGWSSVSPHFTVIAIEFPMVIPSEDTYSTPSPPKLSKVYVIIMGLIMAAIISCTSTVHVGCVREPSFLQIHYMQPSCSSGSDACVPGVDANCAAVFLMENYHTVIQKSIGPSMNDFNHLTWRQPPLTATQTFSEHVAAKLTHSLHVNI